jgi:GT2 family glycosyltransferase
MPTILSHINKLVKQFAAVRPKSKSVRSRFEKIRTTYAITASSEDAKFLQDLVGTTSSIDDVLAAMDAEFDAEWYLALYRDVRQNGVDPEYHYLMWGWKENRIPSRFFDPVYYTSRTPALGATEFPLAHYVKVSQPNGVPGNPISNRIWFDPMAIDEAAWTRVSPARFQPDTRAVVIVPVYKGYVETLTSIYQALNSRGSDCYALLVVNDKSPDESLAKKLKELSQLGLFEFFDSPVNRGFVQTINYALEHLSCGLDAVLLNSDAYVFPGWFGRMIAHADLDVTVATITPLSNNATICSYPVYDRDNYLALELPAEEVDRLSAKANAGLSVEAPTGVGFCFYMRRSAMNTVGLLDEEAFKLGYGEENDFCMRCRNAGMRNIIVGDVFVYHTGSVSFSSTKEENYNQGQTNLLKKHPNYSSDVQRHVSADPERIFRRNLDAERLQKKCQTSIIVVTHRWAGGIDTYLRSYREKTYDDKKPFVSVEVHDEHLVTIKEFDQNGIFVPNLESIDLRIEMAFLIELLKGLSPSLLQINSFAGLDWSSHLNLLNEFSAMGVPITYVGHDYSPISHHYQLLRPDNCFMGIPTPWELDRWSDMKNREGCIDACSSAERQSAYQAFFNAGARVEVPSIACYQIFRNFFPNADISVVPHPDHIPFANEAARRESDGLIHVAVVGAIGPHKGSDVLAALAADAQNRGLSIKYHLLGYSDNDLRLGECGVELWGRYSSDYEAADKLDKIQPDILFVPSIWPETFCYTLSIALKKRIPPVVFNLGAQAERVKSIAWGAVLPLDLSTNPALLSGALLNLPLERLWQDAKQEKSDQTYNSA